MRRGLRPPAPIYPRVWQGNVRDGDKHRIGQEDPWHLVAPFGGIQDVIPTIGFLDPTWVGIAKSINQHYADAVQREREKSGLAEVLDAYGPPPWPNEAGQSPAQPQVWAKAWAEERKRFDEAWEHLPRDLKLSNLSAAYQAAVRLWELGFDWKGRRNGILPMVRSDLIHQIFDPEEGVGALASDQLLGRVCAAEHRRWMMDRAVNGWGALKPGAQRSNGMRLHPNFETYTDLQPQEGAAGTDVRHFDAASIKGIIRALSDRRVGYPVRLLANAAPLALHDIPVGSAGLNPHHINVQVLPLSFVDDAREDMAQRVCDSVGRLESWARPVSASESSDHGFSIQLTAADEELWSAPVYQPAFKRLLKIARAYNVHLDVIYADRTKDRLERARKEKTKDAL